jgi:DNA polymerase-1
LSLEYGVSYVSIDNIIKGKTWTKPPATQRTAEEWATLYGVSAGTIQGIWAGRRWLPEEGISEPRATFSLSQVACVTIESTEITYGLTVEDDCSHVTGGIVTHNTGRLSSTDPNLQNIPNVDKDKWKLRGAFIAGPGNLFVVADYSQLEMRLLACASLQPEMIQIFFEGKDIHMGNASMMMGTPYDDLVLAKDIDKQVKQGKLPESAMTRYVLECIANRAAAKNIGFGLNYGMGPGKLALDLSVSKAEAVAKIELYKKTYPAVTAFYREAIEETERTGYAFTILGRRRNVPGILSHRNDERAKAERIAVNTQIQGSAADVVKMAQINLDRARLDYYFNCHSLLQVHDELVHECPAEMAAAVKMEVKAWMEMPFYDELAVPLTVDASIGPSWLLAK